MQASTAVRSSFGPRVRAVASALLGAAAATGILMVLVRLGRSGWPTDTSGEPSAEVVVAGLLVWAAVALCGWLALGVTLTAAASLPGALGAAFDQLSRWLTPRLLRQGVAVVLGTAVGTVGLPAGAASGAPAHSRAAALNGSTPSPQPVPDPGFRPAGRAPTPAFSPTAPPALLPVSASTQDGPHPVAPEPGWRPSPPARVVDVDESRLLTAAPRSTAEVETAVTVHRGNSLWSIVARHLGPEATDLEIARAWPEWHAANREVIGHDPDLLIPGQQLHPPTGDAR